MAALFAALVHVRTTVGAGQCGLIQRVKDESFPLLLEIGQTRCDACIGKGIVNGVSCEHFTSIGPEVIKRRLHAGVAFLGSVAKAHHQIRGPIDLIGHFLQRFRCDLGDLGVGGVGQGCQQFKVERIKQEFAHDRLADITIRKLDQFDVPELHRIAQIGQIIGCPAFAFDFGRKGVPHLAVPDQIKRGVRQCDILFQRGAVAAPFRGTVPKDQRVIGQTQQPVEQGLPIHIHRDHHMCPASSGMS